MLEAEPPGRAVPGGAWDRVNTNSTTANILLRATGIKTAGVAYASTVGTAIQTYETTTVTARELYLSTLMTVSETAAEATMRADRDKETALSDADLQKQITGNESAHTTAVNNANSAHSTATANAEAARKSAEQAALTQLNSTLAQATKDKEASIAGAERLYDQTVASLDAQYGSASSNGDTGIEGATRRSAIKTRDAQYYAARDTSWATTLSASINLGTTPWTVKAITAANAQAAHSVSRASAQAAHDAAMLDAIEDWQLSNRESLTDLLFTEGQSRETYDVATSNVYANWENGVANLLGGKPEGTGWGVSQRDEFSKRSATPDSKETDFTPLLVVDETDSSCNFGSYTDLSSGLPPLLPQSCSLATSGPPRSLPILVLDPTNKTADDAFAALLEQAAIDDLAVRIASQQRHAYDTMQRIEFATGLSSEEITGKSLGELQLHAAFSDIAEQALRERIAERRAAEAAFALGLKNWFDLNRYGDNLRAIGARTNGSDWDPWVDAYAEYVDGIEQIQLYTITLGWSDHLGATNTDQFQGYGWTASKIGFQVARDSAIAAATFGTGNLIVAGESGLLIRSIFTAGQAYEGYNTLNSSYHAIDQYSQGNLGTGTLYVAFAGLSGGTFATSIARPGIVSLRTGPGAGGRFDAWLAAGQQGGLRRNIAAWRLNNFRNNSTRFYGVFSDDAAARLAAGGKPWPTGMSRANLGEGLYVWGSRTDAASYLQIKQANPAFDAAARGTRIRSFRVGNRDLNRFSRLDLRNVDEATFQRFIDNHTAYTDNFSPHGFEYVIYPRGAGAEHFFDRSVFQYFVIRQ